MKSLSDSGHTTTSEDVQGLVYQCRNRVCDAD